MASARPYAPLRTVLAVAITPTWPLCVRRAAARAPDSITPTTGTSSSSASRGSASAEAVLHATTIAFAPRSIRKWAISREKRVTVSCDLLPYCWLATSS